MMRSKIPLPHRRSTIIPIAALLMVPACATKEQATQKAHEIGARIVLATPMNNDEALGSASSDTVRGSDAPIVEAVTSSESQSEFLSFPYERSARYRLRTAVGAPGTVAFQPGETLVNYAASNNELWIIDATHVDDHTRLLVEPIQPDLSTHLLINTDRRSYLVEATSHQEGEPGNVLAWSYPHEQTVEVIDAVNTEKTEAVRPKPPDPEVKAFSWRDWFANVGPSSSQATRGCRLCRDPDDHGDNDHDRDHDRGDRQNMH